MEDGLEASYALNKFSSFFSFFCFFFVLNYVTWWLWKQPNGVIGVILIKLLTSESILAHHKRGLEERLKNYYYFGAVMT